MFSKRSLRKALFQLMCVGFIISVLLSRLDAMEDGSPHESGKQRLCVVMVIDASGSMAGNPLRHTLAAAEMGCMLLNGELTVVHFSDQAHASQPFRLPEQRAEAIAFIRQIRAGGGTRYDQALQAVPADANAILFLSDGAPSDNVQTILETVKTKIKCEIHTIGLMSSSEADNVLIRMAELTHGGFFRCDQSVQVVEVFLRILGQVRRFQRADDATGHLVATRISGEVIALGFNAQPQFENVSAIDHHVSELPGEKVHAARIVLPNERTQTITTRGSDGQAARVILLRFDLPSPELKFSALPRADGASSILAEASFREASGQPVDVAKTSELSSSFELLAPDGKVIETVAGKFFGSMTQATLKLPSASEPYVIRHVATDRSSGTAFSSTEARTVQGSDLPQRPDVRFSVRIKIRPGRVYTPVKWMVEVGAEGANSNVRQELLKRLCERPPVMRVRSSVAGELEIDSQKQADLFQVRGQVVNDSRLNFDVVLAANAIREAGTYQVSSEEIGLGVGLECPRAEAALVVVDQRPLQVVVKAGRRHGVITLEDSEQVGSSRSGLVGDPVSVEVSNKSLDPREFVALESGLRAKMIGSDGSVTEIPIRYRGDRFVTDASVMKNPGRLRMRVEIESLGFQFERTIEFRWIPIKLNLVEPAVAAQMDRFPQGTLLPFRVSVSPKEDGDKVTREEFQEILERRSICVRMIQRDAADQEFHRENMPASMQPVDAVVWMSRRGQQALVFELTESGEQLVEQVRYRMEINDSPIRVAFQDGAIAGVRRDVSATPPWVLALPAWFREQQPLQLTVTPTSSPWLTRYHVSAVRVGDVESRFVQSEGQFVSEVSAANDHSLAVICALSPYRSLAEEALPELQLREEVVPKSSWHVRWGRLVSASLFGCVLLAGSGFGGWQAVRRSRWRRLQNYGWRILLWGDSCDALSLVPDEPSGWLPRAEVCICLPKEASEPFRLAYPAEVGADERIVAVVRLTHDGRVKVKARETLPHLRANETRVLDLGDDSLPLSDQCTLAVEHRESELAVV